jgi:hypothetical protein
MNTEREALAAEIKRLVVEAVCSPPTQRLAPVMAAIDTLRDHQGEVLTPDVLLDLAEPLRPLLTTSEHWGMVLAYGRAVLAAASQPSSNPDARHVVRQAVAAPADHLTIEQMRVHFEWWWTTRGVFPPIGSRECEAAFAAWIASGHYTAPEGWRASPQPWGYANAANPAPQAVAAPDVLVETNPRECLMAAHIALSTCDGAGRVSAANVAMAHEQIEYVLNALAAHLTPNEDADRRLFDSQWVNIVNSPAVREADKDEAVALAVKMAEQEMAENLRNNTWPAARKQEGK